MSILNSKLLYYFFILFYNYYRGQLERGEYPLRGLMKKVTILALHLGYGGIERAITDLANSLVENYSVEIVSTYKVYDKPVNRLDRRIKVKYLTELKPNKKEFKSALKKFRLVSAFKEGIKSVKILKLKKELMIEFIK